MDNFPELPKKGQHILLKAKKKKTIWKIYIHPDPVLDNLAIVEKTVDNKKPDKKWIVAKDHKDWVKSLVENGYSYTIENDKS